MNTEHTERTVKKDSFLISMAKKLAGKEAGLVFAISGVIVQSWHTFFITYELSSLQSWQRVVQAIIMAFFISSGLLYFTLKTSDHDSAKARRGRRMVLTFAIIESIINLWYWSAKLVIKVWPNPDWFAYVIALPLSIMLPIILKAYGGEVNVFEDVEEKVTESYKQQILDELEKVKEQVTISSSLAKDSMTEMVESIKLGYEKAVGELLSTVKSMPGDNKELDEDSKFFMMFKKMYETLFEVHTLMKVDKNAHAQLSEEAYELLRRAMEEQGNTLTANNKHAINEITSRLLSNFNETMSKVFNAPVKMYYVNKNGELRHIEVEFSEHGALVLSSKNNNELRNELDNQHSVAAPEEHVQVTEKEVQPAEIEHDEENDVIIGEEQNIIEHYGTHTEQNEKAHDIFNGHEHSLIDEEESQLFPQRTVYPELSEDEAKLFN